MPDPEPAAGEVVVEVRAAALNARDGWIAATSGRADLPTILGSDACGRIAEVGPGVQRSPGR